MSYFKSFPLMLVLSLVFAVPASANDVMRHLKTGLFSLYPDQGVVTIVSDVSNVPNLPVSAGTTATVRVYDAENHILGQWTQLVLPDRPMEAELLRSDLSIQDPRLLVRVEVLLQTPVDSDPVLAVNFEIFNELDLTTEERWECVGPPAQDHQEDWNFNCPDVWSTVWLTF